jgi:hypothetical protein
MDTGGSEIRIWRASRRRIVGQDGGEVPALYVSVAPVWANLHCIFFFRVNAGQNVLVREKKRKGWVLGNVCIVEIHTSTETGKLEFAQEFSNGTS